MLEIENLVEKKGNCKMCIMMEVYSVCDIDFSSVGDGV